MTILFFISFVAIALVVSSKIFEIKVRKIERLVLVYKKGDEQIHLFIEKIFAFYNKYRKISYIFIFEYVPAYLYELIVKCKQIASKKYYEIEHKLNGHRTLGDRGSVSAFLQNITEDK